MIICPPAADLAQRPCVIGHLQSKAIHSGNLTSKPVGLGSQTEAIDKDRRGGYEKDGRIMNGLNYEGTRKPKDYTVQVLRDKFEKEFDVEVLTALQHWKCSWELMLSLPPSRSWSSS